MDLRQTTSGDRSLVEGLLSSASHSHVHLDWLDPTNLTDKEPFIIAMDGGAPVGVLGCPPELPAVSWVRAFAVADGFDTQNSWDFLWAEGVAHLLQQNIELVAALALEAWFEQVLTHSGFTQSNSVMFYEFTLDSQRPVQDELAFSLRPIRSADEDAILDLDRSAFDHMWQLSAESLRVALIQASSATLIEHQGEILGYQITTASPFGAHLARLAVHPSRQRAGLGTTLVRDAIKGVREYGLDRLSVNTQENNEPSRRLYEKLGFRESGKIFPVFEIRL